MIKAIDKWGYPFLKNILTKPSPKGEIHVMIALCDHFEPLSPNASKSIKQGEERVQRWLDQWPTIASGIKDSDGCEPKHTIFYPAEEAERPDHFIPKIKPIVDSGYAEVEIHLHHDNDTADGLTATLEGFRDYLSQEQLLGLDEQGNAKYGFIHGNWALCNSRPDGRHCGVNEEIEILLKTGCYADFTFPSLPSPTQPKNFCNNIYFAKNIPGRPRSHDHGRLAKVGIETRPEELLLFQGPVALNWSWRKWGVIPRIEHADLCGTNPPSPQRADLWIRKGIHVARNPNWIFVKLHTHGCLESNMKALLNGKWEETLTYLQNLQEENPEVSIHFVSAREMYNISQAAIYGHKDNPGNHRDFKISKPLLHNRLEK
ncbi:MAG: hypothetical protein MI748_19115 [Opitutales bacterium]|nr:hypothetical protein [Opitutales bacterium]